VIGFFAACGTGYLVSLVFAKPDPVQFAGTLFQRPRGSPGAHQTNWRPYDAALGIYAVGILLMLVVMTLTYGWRPFQNSFFVGLRLL
jgi:hypothetical protein